VKPPSVTGGPSGYIRGMGKLMGRITEFLGQWTNDRETEARGRAELKDPDPDAPVPGSSDPTVEAEEERVRREHGDVSR
jgi:hypothetical protein